MRPPTRGLTCAVTAGRRHAASAAARAPRIMAKAPKFFGAQRTSAATRPCSTQELLVRVRSGRRESRTRDAPPPARMATEFTPAHNAMLARWTALETVLTLLGRRGESSSFKRLSVSELRGARRAPDTCRQRPARTPPPAPTASSHSHRHPCSFSLPLSLCLCSSRRWRRPPATSSATATLARCSRFGLGPIRWVIRAARRPPSGSSSGRRRCRVGLAPRLAAATTAAASGPTTTAIPPPPPPPPPRPRKGASPPPRGA